jgi:hypothetical protein
MSDAGQSVFCQRKYCSVGPIEVMACPRCGKPLYEPGEVRGRGRPRRWCSAQCRKLASEERRAADRGAVKIDPDRGAVKIDVRDHARSLERIAHQPFSSDGAVDVERMLHDPGSIEKLLRTLTHRIQNPSDKDPSARWLAERQRHLVADLLHAVDDNHPAHPVPRPAAPIPRPAPQDAVRTVLSSPRATREVLDALAEQANDGNLLDGRHSGTLDAAERLLEALIKSRTLRPRQGV